MKRLVLGLAVLVLAGCGGSSGLDYARLQWVVDASVSVEAADQVFIESGKVSATDLEGDQIEWDWQGGGFEQRVGVFQTPPRWILRARGKLVGEPARLVLKATSLDNMGRRSTETKVVDLQTGPFDESLFVGKEIVPTGR